MGLTKKRPTEPIKDDEIRKHIEDLQEEVTGEVIELSAAPTASEPLLEDMEWGVYDDILYHRVKSKIYEFTPTETITISS